jgi:hypothetical protein
VKLGRYTNESFWKEVNQRRFELQKLTNAATKGPMLLFGEQIDKSKALLRRLPDEDSDGSIKTEVHVLVGYRYVTLEQESYSKSEVLAELSYKNVDPSEAENRLKMIASNLLPYEKPGRARSGFCMQDVVFDVGQDDETAQFNFYAKDYPDVHINLSYHAVTGQPEQGVYDRVAQGIRQMPILGHASAVLRKGDRALGGGAAEEYLSKTIRPVTQHLFMIERRDSEPRTLERPFFGLTLSTGNEYGEGHDVHRQDNSSLSDEQVLKLWDDMVASVRKR